MNLLPRAQVININATSTSHCCRAFGEICGDVDCLPLRTPPPRLVGCISFLTFRCRSNSFGPCWVRMCFRNEEGSVYFFLQLSSKQMHFFCNKRTVFPPQTKSITSSEWVLLTCFALSDGFVNVFGQMGQLYGLKCSLFTLQSFPMNELTSPLCAFADES